MEGYLCQSTICHAIQFVRWPLFLALALADRNRLTMRECLWQKWRKWSQQTGVQFWLWAGHSVQDMLSNRECFHSRPCRAVWQVQSRSQGWGSCRLPNRAGRQFHARGRSGDQLKEKGHQQYWSNQMKKLKGVPEWDSGLNFLGGARLAYLSKQITYTQNRFYSSDDKVSIFPIDASSKTDASKDEDTVEGDRPVSQHGHDQRKGETTEDTAEEDKGKKFGWGTQNTFNYDLRAYLASSSFRNLIVQVFLLLHVPHVPNLHMHLHLNWHWHLHWHLPRVAKEPSFRTSSTPLSSHLWPAMPPFGLNILQSKFREAFRILAHQTGFGIPKKEKKYYFAYLAILSILFCS